jgi:hypothetical protein
MGRLVLQSFSEEKIGMKDEDSPSDVKNENRIRLGPRLKTPGTRFRYLYDFGDGWEHSIALEAILDRDGAPRCLTGERGVHRKILVAQINTWKS